MKMTRKKVRHFISFEVLSNIIFGDDAAVTSSPWERHHDENFLLYIIKWPLVFLLWITVPDCKKHPKLRGLTFLLCILYIGGTSYIVSFLITIFGTFFCKISIIIGTK